jgi:hypothetical protein
MSSERQPSTTSRARRSPRSPLPVRALRWLVVQTRGHGSQEFVVQMEDGDERTLVLGIARILLTQTANIGARAHLYDIDPDSTEFDGREPIGSMDRSKAQEALPRVRPVDHWELAKLPPAELAQQAEAQRLRESRQKQRDISDARQTCDALLSRPSAVPLLAGPTRFFEIVQPEPPGSPPVPLGRVIWIPTKEVDALEREVAVKGWGATSHLEGYVGPRVTGSMLWNAHGDEDAQRHIWIAAATHDLNSHLYRSPVPSAFEHAIHTLLRQHEWWHGWHHNSSALPAFDQSDRRFRAESKPWSEDQFLEMLVHQVTYARDHWTVVRIYQTPTGLRVVE